VIKKSNEPSSTSIDGKLKASVSEKSDSFDPSDAFVALTYDLTQEES
jgi:hypothetical protein